LGIENIFLSENRWGGGASFSNNLISLKRKLKYKDVSGLEICGLCCEYAQFWGLYKRCVKKLHKGTIEGLKID
jgi:hypothetical protein